MSPTSTLESVCAKLGIGFIEKHKLKTNGITDYKSLKTKRNDLERIDLQIGTQTALMLVFQYLDSLSQDSTGEGDPLSRFNLEDYEEFIVSSGNLPTAPPAPYANGDGPCPDGSVSPSHGSDQDPADKKRKLGPTIHIHHQTNVTVSSGDEGEEENVVVHDNDDDDDDDDDDSPKTIRIGTRKTRAIGTDDDESFDEKAPIVLEKFAFPPQGFDPKEANDSIDLFDQDPIISAKTDFAHLRFMDFEGRRFTKGCLYQWRNRKGEVVVVGIKAFKSKTKAVCVRILHATQTFLGGGETAQEFTDILKKHFDGCMFVRLERMEVIRLAELGLKCGDEEEILNTNTSDEDEDEDNNAKEKGTKDLQYPEYIPRLIYVPRLPGNRQSFAYYCDHANDANNRVRVHREEIRLLEGFAGAGGMHLGYHEEGFHTVTAVEYDDAAVQTLKLNNPDLKVYHGDICKFIKEVKSDERDPTYFCKNIDTIEDVPKDPTKRAELGRIDAIHISSPCQGFSRANTNEFGNPADMFKNEMCMNFVDFLELSGALVGVFENVEGMWSVRGMPYLKRLMLKAMMLGYQVRLMLLRSNDYGDPQKRPRFIIFAAKHFVDMPHAPTKTHGPGRENPYATPRQMLDILRTPWAKAQNFPNMDVCRTTSLKEGEQKTQRLPADQCAKTVLASGPPVWHYEEDRCINVREAATLQGFPFDYEFCGTQTEQYCQAGNAVPVEFARAIARSVRESLRFVYLEELEETPDSTKSTA